MEDTRLGVRCTHRERFEHQDSTIDVSNRGSLRSIFPQSAPAWLRLRTSDILQASHGSEPPPWTRFEVVIVPERRKIRILARPFISFGCYSCFHFGHRRRTRAGKRGCPVVRRCKRLGATTTVSKSRALPRKSC